MWRVLCVDDDLQLADQVGEYLSSWENSGIGEFECVSEKSFSAAVRRLRYERFDLVILDVNGNNAEDGPTLDGDGNEQGERVLASLREIRFVPVIFVTGYVKKVEHHLSAVVKVVSKGGSDEMALVRAAAKEIMSTGLPDFAHWVEGVQREYLWKTVADHWHELSQEAAPTEISGLLERRIATQIERGQARDKVAGDAQARPIDYYVYPTLSRNVETGNVYEIDGIHHVVVTPACDLVDRKDKGRRCNAPLLVRGQVLERTEHYIAWQREQWVPSGNKSEKQNKHWLKLRDLLRNGGSEHFRFLPGTFFLPSLVINLQDLVTKPFDELNALTPICTLDSPFREEFLLQLSRFYGRLGTPDLDVEEIIRSRVEKVVGPPAAA